MSPPGGDGGVGGCGPRTRSWAAPLWHCTHSGRGLHLEVEAPRPDQPPEKERFLFPAGLRTMTEIAFVMRLNAETVL